MVLKRKETKKERNIFEVCGFEKEKTNYFLSWCFWKGKKEPKKEMFSSWVVLKRKERKKEMFSKWVVLKRKERNIFEVCEFEKEKKKYFRGVWFWKGKKERIISFFLSVFFLWPIRQYFSLSSLRKNREIFSRWKVLTFEKERKKGFSLFNISFLLKYFHLVTVSWPPVPLRFAKRTKGFKKSQRISWTFPTVVKQIQNFWKFIGNFQNFSQTNIYTSGAIQTRQMYQIVKHHDFYPRKGLFERNFVPPVCQIISWECSTVLKKFKFFENMLETFKTFSKPIFTLLVPFRCVKST